MSETRLYHVERETNVTIADFKPDVMTEKNCFAWVLVDTVETTTASWKVMHDWFEHQTTPAEGRYRLVEVTPYGGNYFEYEVKRTWSLEEVKRVAVAV